MRCVLAYTIAVCSCSKICYFLSALIIQLIISVTVAIPLPSHQLHMLVYLCAVNVIQPEYRLGQPDTDMLVILQTILAGSNHP